MENKILIAEIRFADGSRLEITDTSFSNPDEFKEYVLRECQGEEIQRLVIKEPIGGKLEFK